MKKLHDLISTYEDFPKQGISFKDILGITQDPEVFRKLISSMSSSQIVKNSDAIVSIDARGFIFGSAISLQSSKPMIVARKPGKLPGELVKMSYSLEYGENFLTIQKKSLEKFDSYAIVDDLIATGGTVECVANLLKNNAKEVVGLLTVVELSNLEGRKKFDFPVESIISMYPTEPAVKPITRKNTNSVKSLGRELNKIFS